MASSRHEKDVAFPLTGDAVATDPYGKQTSKWAKGSLLCACLAWIIGLSNGFLADMFKVTNKPVNTHQWIIFAIISLLFIGCLLSATVSILTGIIGIIHINRKSKTTKGTGLCFGGIFLGFVFLLIALGIPALDVYKQHMWPYWDCERNLSSLRSGIKKYSEKNDNIYPPAERWCDELLKNEFVYVKDFCYYGADPNYYELETNVSHYAMNPDCEPHSAENVVLLFDSKTGWNQNGGAELLAPENHKGKGCNILFNDGTVKFVKKKDFNKLRWE